MKSSRADLGSLVQDKVTGIKGTMVARTEWQHGCVRLSIQPSGFSKDKKPYESFTTDEENVVVLKAVTSPSKPSGGPHDAPQMYANPQR